MEVKQENIEKVTTDDDKKDDNDESPNYKPSDIGAVLTFDEFFALSGGLIESIVCRMCEWLFMSWHCIITNWTGFELILR